MSAPGPKEMMKFRADSVLRRAIRLRAAYEDRDQQDVIVDILREALDEEIKQVERRDGATDQAKTEESSKKPRKRTDGQ